MNIRIDLDSVRQDISVAQNTYRMVNRASTSIPGHRTKLEAPSLQTLCGTLVEMGVSGGAEVFRGKTQVFSTPIDVGLMAKGRLTQC